jgi:predicted aspartyl protease
MPVRRSRAARPKRHRSVGRPPVSTFTVPIVVGGSEQGPFERIEAWVDTGSLYSWMPADLLERLGVRAHGTRSFTLANGDEIDRPVGRVWLTYDDRTELTIVVLGEPQSQTLLGAYALEGLAMAADPVNERIVPVASINAFAARRTR